MANLKKNGNLSGAIGQIVFVNDGQRTFARLKPDTVKQTPEPRLQQEFPPSASPKTKSVVGQKNL